MSKKTKYVDPMLDLSFKKIFGTDPNKDLLIAFLNEIFKGRKCIVDLVYNKNEHHGNNKEEGSAVFDLLCTGDKGEKFLIEVQHSRPLNFKKRAIFYTSRLISEQAPKGKMKDWLYDITEVYFVGILENDITGDSRYLHDICLCYRDTREIFYDELGYTFIELSNFVKTKDELESDLDNWLYSLKHLSEMDNLPPHLQKTIFEKLYNIAEYSLMTKEEQQIYDQELKRKWDNAAVKAQQLLELEEAKARAEEQGKIEGRTEEKREIAQSLKKMGLSPEKIAEATGLSIEEINAL